MDRAEWDRDDALRPLTRPGRKRVTRVVQAARPLLSTPALWLCSPWVRAAETAAIAAEILGVEIHTVPWLAGGAASATQLLGQLRTLPGSPEQVVLVGHEPDLGQYLGTLLGSPPLPLRKAGLAVVEGDATPGGMRLRMLLPPGALLQLVRG